MAPRARAVEGGEALIHMLLSRKVNPDWTRANYEMVAQINTISRQAANDMSARIAAHYPASSGASTTSGSMSDTLSQQWQNSTMDQTDVIDQATGQSYKVDSGSSYYWINSQGATLFPPVHGGFSGDHGTFYGADEDGGKPVQVRFNWEKQGPVHARWSQAFSPDGVNWETNWVMEFTRMA